MKKDNNILLIAGAVLLYFLLRKKATANKSGGGSGSGAGSGSGLFNNVTPMQRAKIRANVKEAVSKINIEPIADEMDDFKTQYQQDIKQCKI